MGFHNNRDSRGGNRDNFNRGGGRREFGNRTMHSTICSKCKNSCEVPFKPTGEKPVYCKDCFVRDDSRDSRGPRRDGPRGGSIESKGPNLKRELTEMNDKLDRILAALGEY